MRKGGYGKSWGWGDKEKDNAKENKIVGHPTEAFSRRSLTESMTNKKREAKMPWGEKGRATKLQPVPRKRKG